MQTESEFLLTSADNIFVNVSSIEEGDNPYYDPALNSAERVLRIMRGERCGTVSSLYQEWAAALQFPSYAIGAGWDSFHECVIDLDWPIFASAERITLYQTHTSRVLCREPQERSSFFEIMRVASGRFVDGRRRGALTLDSPPRVDARLSIVFHSIPEELPALAALLREHEIYVTIPHV